MKNVVNQAPFVLYPKVIKMLSAVEALFKNIESLPSASAEAGTRVPVSPQQWVPFPLLFAAEKYGMIILLCTAAGWPLSHVLGRVCRRGLLCRYPQPR